MQSCRAYYHQFFSQRHPEYARYMDDKPNTQQREQHDSESQRVLLLCVLPLLLPVLFS